MPSQESPLFDPQEEEFAQALAEIERSLFRLRERYAQIQQAQQRQAELQQQQQEANSLPELQTELQGIQAELQELDVVLESALLSDQQLRRLFWQGLRTGLLGEVFWQIVRFGGLGVVLGWLLKSFVG